MRTSDKKGSFCNRYICRDLIVWQTYSNKYFIDDMAKHLKMCSLMCIITQS